MIGGLVTHAMVYVAVCTGLSLIWVLLGGGSLDDLRHYLGTPGDALNRDFWPIWVWLLWGIAVVAHLASVVGRLLTPSYWSRRVRDARRLREAGAGPAEALLGAAAGEGPTDHGPRGPHRRPIAVMFTDIAGSMLLNETLGDEAWARLLGRHRELVRACTQAWDGTEVVTQGDGFLVRFDGPLQAVRCAVEIQRTLDADRGAGAAMPEVRIGIHVGEAVHHDGDVLGQVVNVAARVVDAARPGEVLVTESVADGVNAVPLDDRGLVALKGVRQPRHLLAVRWREADPADAPPAPA